jgi:protein involved in polysaccharide export with SLBB domain
MRSSTKNTLALAAAILFATAGAIPQFATPVAAQSGVEKTYHLGVGDKVKIDVFGEDKLSGEYQVGSDGSMPFPLIGSIPAEGLTMDALRVALTEKLAGGYLLNPRVTVQVSAFRPYYIMGEVERPGRYPTEPGITLTRAIATAGGFTYRANTRFVFVRREGQSKEERVSLASDAVLNPGDVVRIGERYF